MANAEDCPLAPYVVNDLPSFPIPLGASVAKQEQGSFYHGRDELQELADKVKACTGSIACKAACGANVTKAILIRDVMSRAWHKANETDINMGGQDGWGE